MATNTDFRVKNGLVVEQNASVLGNLTVAGTLTGDGSGLTGVSSYTSTNFTSDLATKTTDNLGEGTTNLYFTTARARDVISAGTGVTITTGSIAIGQAVGTSDNVSFNNLTLAGELRGPATFVIDPAAIGDDTGTVIIKGNLQVDGTTTTINSTTLAVADKNIVLASGATDSAMADGAGITVNGAAATLIYVDSGTKWQFNKNVDITANTASTTATTGALTVAGGVGVAGAVYAGASVTAESFTARSETVGAGRTLKLLGSTGSGTAGQYNGNGTIEIIGGGVAYGWTAFLGALNSRRRGGILLQAGLAAADESVTYSNGSSIEILGSNGTNNGVSIGQGSRITIQSGGSINLTGTNDGSRITLFPATSAGGGGISITGGGGNTASVGAGTATLSGGNSLSGNGGGANLFGGISNGGAGGSVAITAGNSTGVAGGNVNITSGSGTTPGKIGFNIGALGEIALFNTDGNLELKQKLAVGYSDFTNIPANGAAFLGSVGIGTSSPLFKLDVRGDASINGVIVGLGAGAVAGNTVVGASALASNTGGGSNTAIGYNAMSLSTFPQWQTAVGTEALKKSQGSSNTAVGAFALQNTTAGNDNTVVGAFTLSQNITGANNTAVGHSVLANHTAGSRNVAVGGYALATQTAGNNNTVIGFFAGYGLTSGSRNTFVGTYNGTDGSGSLITSGSANTILGGFTGLGGPLNMTTASNYIVLSDGDGNPRQIINDSGNLSLGATLPSAWWGNSQVIEIGYGTTLEGRTNLSDFAAISANVFIDSSGVQKYISSGSATSYQQLSGEHFWCIAPYGFDAGNPIAGGLTQAMKLTANGDLGVGTTAPNISGWGKAVTLQGISNAAYEVTDGTVVTNLVAAAGAFGIVGTQTDHPLLLRTNGTERARIDSSGNVGIGTTAPTQSLHVVGANSGTGGYTGIFQNSTNATNNGGGYLFQNDHSNHSWGTVAEFRTITGSSGADRPSIIFSSDKDAISWSVGFVSGTNDNFRIVKNHGHRAYAGSWAGTNGGWGTEYLTINTSGNVGIGSTSPSTPLSIGSSTHTSPSDTNRILNWYGTTGGTEIANANHSISVGNDSAVTTQPMAVALSLFNVNITDNNWSPAITFGGKSTSGNFMNGAAAIAAKLPANSSDNNFRGGDLHFFTQGTLSAGRGLTSKMVIKADGNVIVGATGATSTAKFEVHGTNGQLFSVTDSMSGTIFSVNDISGIPSIEVLDTGLVKVAQYSGNVVLGSASDNGSKLQVNGDATATNFNSLSDVNAKQEIYTIENALEKALALRGVNYVLKSTQQKQIGVIAQEVELVIPEVVNTASDGTKSVSYGNIVGLLIEAIKDQQAQIDALKKLLEK